MSKHFLYLRFFFFSLIASATVMSYSKSDSPTDSGTNTNKPATEYYIEATADAKQMRLEASTTDLSGIYMGNTISSSIGDNYFETQVTYFRKMPFTGQNLIDLRVPSLAIGVAKHYNWKPGKVEYASFLRTGAYTFGSHNDKKEGAVVNFRDANGQSWSSNERWEDQQGSSFEITEVSEVTDTPGLKESHFKVKANFSGTVYNDNGASKAISNGKVSCLTIYY